VKVKIQVIIESDDGRVQDVEEVACVQRSMTEHQVGDYNAERINCPCCGRRRVQKGHHPILFRTLFGKLTLNSLRLHHCDCQPTPSKTFSLLAELLPERTAPELLYLEAKWCTLLSFGMTFDLLQEVLPMSEELNVTSLRANLHKVAVRMETELGDERQNFLESDPQSVPMNSMPEPKPPLAVALDGAYVHAAGDVERKERWFEVVVGKSITAPGEGKYLGFVLNYDEKPKRRLYESLRSQGLELGQPVTFFSDGEDTLRQLQMYVSPQSEHILDWFHITMKLTVINQMRKSLVGTEPAAWLGEVEKDLESPEVALVERQRRPGVEAGRWPEDHARWRTDQLGPAKAAAHDSRIRQLHRRQSGLHPRLRRPPSQWRTNQFRFCRVGRKPTCQPANGQTATNALDRARRSPVVAGSRASDERRPTRHFQTLVSRYESGLRRPTSPRSLISSWPAPGSRIKSATPRFFSDSFV
jgi:hypothetical protein